MELQPGLFQMLFRGTVSLKTGQFHSLNPQSLRHGDKDFLRTQICCGQSLSVPIPQTPPEDDRSTVGPAAVCVFIKTLVASQGFQL